MIAASSGAAATAPSAPDGREDHRRTLSTEGRGGLPINLRIERQGAEWICHGDAGAIEREAALLAAENKLKDCQADILELVRS